MCVCVCRYVLWMEHECQWNEQWLHIYCWNHTFAAITLHFTSLRSDSTFHFISCTQLLHSFAEPIVANACSQMDYYVIEFYHTFCGILIGGTVVHVCWWRWETETGLDVAIAGNMGCSMFTSGSNDDVSALHSTSLYHAMPHEFAHLFVRPHRGSQSNSKQFLYGEIVRQDSIIWLFHRIECKSIKAHCICLAVN